MDFQTEEEKQLFYIDKCREIIKQKENNLGRKLTACVVTFGCQMNFKDSEKLVGILTEMGYEEIDDEHADLVLYNTCTVRENANFKIYGRLGYLSKIKEKNPDMIVGLCGCMMQEKHVVDKLNKSYRFIDLIFGTHNLYNFAELMYERLSENHKVEEILEGTDKIVEDLPTIRKYSFKSGVNIMFGCNNFCSYCIVPYVRGRERSRKPEDIVKEVEKLVSEGVVEVMLLGQNVNSYGKTLDEPISFAELLRRVTEVDGLKRIRFMTSHPKDLSDELIETMHSSEKICKQFHLPMQSGSNRILKEMNRHYTREDYLEIVRKLRESVPDIGLSTDIIVGFPGETEEDFQDTLELIKECRFDSVFTFIYSKRTGTPAAEMPNQVEESVIKDRFNRLLKVVNQISNEKINEKIGETVEVLIEEKNEKLDNFISGRLSNNTVVHVPGDESLIGTIQNVKLNEAKGFYYMGEIVN
ncbi:MAG: tRNA (N6-isopentenyl adenosine(37)-C2)-methylthiotransferase MiaB [Eubacterium sp.]|nr:tRNA (N6-isopentenyl adenosine(37)-C2)-methylthiotransferase MiaB [Eubacterium sp.]